MSRQLRQAAADYLAIRRGLGFKLQGYDRLLADFLGYLERSGASTITVQAAVAWATAPAGASAGRWSDRLGAVRGLARYLHGIDSSVEVPPVELIACRRQRRTPYLYSPSDITRLVRAAASLRPALRGATYEAFFGLLSCTGMRVGETIALDRGDVDLRAGELEINDAKFRKHRRLPLHGSTVAALRRYAEVRRSEEHTSELQSR
jgi:integrase